jgi:hypothetical protein
VHHKTVVNRRSGNHRTQGHSNRCLRRLPMAGPSTAERATYFVQPAGAVPTTLRLLKLVAYYNYRKTIFMLLLSWLTNQE